MATLTSWNQQSSLIVQNDLKGLRQYLNSGDYKEYKVSPKKQFSLLHVAARYGRTIMIEELLGMGMSSDGRDAWGHTPLHYASLCGHKNVIVSLIQNRADVAAQNDMGHTPLDYAATNEVAAVIRRFYSRIAKASVKGKTLPDHVQRIFSWLQHNRCEEYLDMFLVSGFDDITFIQSTGLSEADLDAIGVHKVGHRKKLAALHKIKQFLPAHKNLDSEEDESDNSLEQSSEETSSTENSDSSSDESSVDSSDDDNYDSDHSVSTSSSDDEDSTQSSSDASS